MKNDSNWLCTLSLYSLKDTVCGGSSHKHVHGGDTFLVRQVQLALRRVRKDQLNGRCSWLLPRVSLRGCGNVLPNNSCVDTLKVALGVKKLVGTKSITVVRLRLKMEIGFRG